MGYVLLLALGATLGWFHASALCANPKDSVGWHLTFGIVGALVGGIAIDGFMLAHGITAQAVLVASLSAAVVLGGFHLTSRTLVR
ncbi:MAG: hypothetical protein WA954_04260 [Parerythrobacter sp.]